MKVRKNKGCDTGYHAVQILRCTGLIDAKFVPEVVFNHRYFAL